MFPIFLLQYFYLTKEIFGRTFIKKKLVGRSSLRKRIVGSLRRPFQVKEVRPSVTSVTPDDLSTGQGVDISSMFGLANVSWSRTGSRHNGSWDMSDSWTVKLLHLYRS
jgi:hypothetical protein